MADLTTDDGIRLHYLVRGDGPRPVIYLHWMGGQTSYWTILWERMASDAWQHVAVDFRGHGKSDPRPSSFTAERLARDVLQVADALALREFALVGHSFGGKIALRLAAMAPERVAGLMLLGPVGPGQVEPLGRDALEPVLSRTADAAFIRECFQPWFVDWSHRELDQALEDLSRTPNWALRAVAEVGLWTDLAAEISRLDQPALVMAGDRDPVYGPEYQRDAVLPVLTRAREVTLRCGHGFHLECPEDVAAHGRRFLAELSPW
jgi:pimeloyl-ACP methyl ester carboxylesterase